MEANRDFGAYMKRLREERGVALRDIADTTKIPITALEALERNDISRLPGGIFSRGVVRAYAEQVGADPEKTVREFLARFPHDSVTNGSPYVESAEREPAGPSVAVRLGIVLALLVLAGAAYLAWLFFFQA